MAAGADPALLFIHGAFSSTEGSFGDLLNYFAARHDLVPFAYEWRLSIEA